MPEEVYDLVAVDELQLRQGEDPVDGQKPGASPACAG
jgi:hypothetical protein